MTQQPLSLAQRLLARIGELSERSDVIVHQHSHSWSNRVGKWAGKLPADMLAFYQELNGLVFRYAFADEPDAWHGLEFLALDEGGKKTIDTWRRVYRLPHQAVKRYPSFFFQEGSLSPSEPALFFFGDDSGWGIIMSGNGEDVRFHHWDNDGFLRPLGTSFTALVERLIARGFAHTWAYSDTHPDTDAVVARLATPAPLRATFEIAVEAREELTADQERRKKLEALDQASRDKLLRALGLGKGLATRGAEEKLEALAAACATTEGMDDKSGKAAMAAMGLRNRSLEDFRAWWWTDGKPRVRVQVKIQALEEHPPTQREEGTLVRALHAIPDLRVTAGFPGAPEVLRYMLPLRRIKMHWTPFEASKSIEGWTNARKPSATYELVLSPAQAQGLESGKTFTSTGLASVETKIDK